MANGNANANAWQWQCQCNGIASIMINLAIIYACIKGHLDPTHLKSSPLFTFSTKSLGQDTPSIHRLGVKSLTILEEGEFKVPIDVVPMARHFTAAHYRAMKTNILMLHTNFEPTLTIFNIPFLHDKDHCIWY